MPNSDEETESDVVQVIEGQIIKGESPSRSFVGLKTFVKRTVDRSKTTAGRTG